MKTNIIYTSYKDFISMFLDEALFFSFYNSPYPAHKFSTAIDIYPKDEPLFPFDEGRVIFIKWFNAPRKRSDALDKEPLILVQLTPFTVAKILHVEPRVRVGEKIYYGDPLGRLIVSGYMYVWSEKHMHIEIRPLHDPLRVRGAYRLKILSLRKEVPTTNSIEGIVTHRNTYYVLIKPSKTIGYGPTPLSTGNDKTQYFLEGGYPHYGYIAMINPGKNKGEIDLGLYNASLYEAPTRDTVLVDKETGQVFHGVSIHFSREYIKLVSRKPINNVREGDYITLGKLFMEDR
ncbi:hypothetical protein J4526_06475 [Desulfurococcaceae archaeon MEX13E-LK6-19]|nr:hypothetical protein J4526_06475 [Desulfurococcaceae archaeon MEX13E-LK6-19]